MDYYSWAKALHIISIIAWMAGMLYLPRLYVYHADAEPGSDKSETFKIMERRLLKAITTPAMIASFVFGFAMVALNPDLFSQGWFHVKLACVFVLAGAHGSLSKHQKAFAEDRNEKSSRYFRIINEIPTVLMIIIVFMVILQPF